MCACVRACVRARACVCERACASARACVRECMRVCMRACDLLKSGSQQKLRKMANIVDSSIERLRLRGFVVFVLILENVFVSCCH